jgi:phosphoribosyl 1,2-cyclic phosphodiesterase
MSIQYRLFDELPATRASLPESITPPDLPLRPRVARPLSPLQLCVLGSGSGGNSTVVRLGKCAILLDAGFGPATTARRLQQTGLTVGDIKAICVSHLDADHFRPTWINTLVGFGIRVFLHRWHRKHLDQIEGSETLYNADLVRFFENDPFDPFAGHTATGGASERIAISTVRLPHDDKGTSAFHIQTAYGRIGFATDLGHVPDELVRAFAGVDVLLIESNYDPQMQLTSSRPAFLKKRIMGGHGHLSNEQCLAVCRRIADASPHGNPQRIVLLHRSQQCNTAELVREVFAGEPRFAKRVTLTEQRRRTPWIEVKRLRPVDRGQMSLLAPAPTAVP